VAEAGADARRPRPLRPVRRLHVPRQTWPTDSTRWHGDAGVQAEKRAFVLRRLAWILALVAMVTIPFIRTVVCSRRGRGPSDEVPLIDGSADPEDDFPDWDQVSYPYGTRQRA
jgi:hypothetical protein